MYLHLVLPDRAQVDDLLTARRAGSVSIYLATDPASDGRAERIELGTCGRRRDCNSKAAEADKRALEVYDANSMICVTT